MNLPYLIARRISNNVSGSFSVVINKIAVVSVAVALAALLCTFMIFKGFESTIKEKIYSFGGHLDISKYTTSTSFEEGSIVVSDSLIDGIRNLPGIKYVQPYVYKAGLLKTSEEVQGVFVKGVDANFDTLSFQKHMIEGFFPNLGDEKYTTEVVISKKIANYLQLQVSDDVMIFFVQNPHRYRKLKITGIYETGLEDFDEKVILGDIRMLRLINRWNENTVGGLEVFLHDPSDMDAAEEMVFRQTDSNLYVNKVSDKYAQIFDWLRLLDRNVIIFFVIVLFVASMSMVSILLILIMERTQMIGVLKALGADNGLVSKIFFVNGLRLIFKGMFWGNVIAIGICVVQYYFKVLPLDPANYYMSHVPVAFDWLAVVWINVFAVLVTAITMFIPLMIIAQINPMKSIRFD